MDITPYIKLMLDKNADSLTFETDSAPHLRLSGQDKAIGKNLLNSAALNKIFTELTDYSQQVQFSADKAVKFSASLLDKQNFIER